MIAEWARWYVGIPFRNRGRERHDGLDCWGLVRLVLSEVFAKHLPSFDAEYESCANVRAVEMLVNLKAPVLRARCVDDPELGDVVLLKLRGFACHVGVYVGDNCMLHIRRGCNAVVEELSRPIWARRVEGFYRV